MQSFTDAVVNTFMIEKKNASASQKKKICMFAPFTRHLHGMQIDANISHIHIYIIYIHIYIYIYIYIYIRALEFKLDTIS